jgi:hypothetical protein
MELFHVLYVENLDMLELQLAPIVGAKNIKEKVPEIADGL